MDISKRHVDSARAVSVIKIAGPNCWPRLGHSILKEVASTSLWCKT